MAARLHHAFILTAETAPEAERLIDIGLVEGPSNTHPGQGTANRRFFFEDFYLELAYFTDSDEARTGPGSVIRSLARFESDNGSPFGLVFKADETEDIAAIPGFPYQPLYFDEGQHFIIGDNADVLAEPTCVLAPPNLPNRPPQTLSDAPYDKLTALRLRIPVQTMSPTLVAANAIDRVDIEPGGPNLMTIEFGSGRLGKSFDLRPDLPLVIRC